MLHTLVSVDTRAQPATEPGGLDYYRAICSCGHQHTASLASVARSLGMGHVRWANNQEASTRTYGGSTRKRYWD